ncbi:hypothetical protein BU25DRAFT_117978 [Macroventuria anomochaeta]|uniref:Uncharacterized protein n=1 Tax=Macroventuria anomochaeta TaxID=301207 RepID=A0ACB6RVH9_9PLEO|nr:uncharacterized protein BU25DRAFT_117978 [Macroventuria anomochaeta]KAF2625287.1 hypothetical protein BU25DRAFT_117978 [Macroventuria anomochaeta]
MMASNCNPWMQGPSVSPVSTLQLNQKVLHLRKFISRKPTKVLAGMCAERFQPCAVSHHSNGDIRQRYLSRSRLCSLSEPELLRTHLQHMIWVSLAYAAMPLEDLRWTCHVQLPSRATSTVVQRLQSTSFSVEISTFAASAKSLQRLRHRRRFWLSSGCRVDPQRRPYSPI